MENEISYVLVTPYTLQKARAGIVMQRLLSRTDLTLAAAQVLAPDSAFCRDFAALLEKNNADCFCRGKWCSDYVRTRMIPAADGKFQRVLLLLMRGENACAKVREIVGGFSKTCNSDGITIRDTVSDVVLNDDGTPRYFEPGVLIPSTPEAANAELAMLAKLAEKTPNIVENIVKNDSCNDRTLVIFKPENWRRPSIRPGALLDIFTRTGLRLVGCKVHHISVAQALEFYGPVQNALRSKLAPKIAEKAKAALEKEFGVALRGESLELLTRSVGQDFADDQFNQIVEFMSGTRPDQCPEAERNRPGKAQVMILIYEGENPVDKVRTVLGPTDPSKAPGGTIRGEFGTNVMVNSAHASDSQESYVRESGIVRIMENQLSDVVQAYLA